MSLKVQSDFGPGTPLIVTSPSDGEITVEHPLEGVAAVYHKPSDQPQLILRRRAETNDYELLARWEAVTLRPANSAGLCDDYEQAVIQAKVVARYALSACHDGNATCRQPRTARSGAQLTEGSPES